MMTQALGGHTIHQIKVSYNLICHAGISRLRLRGSSIWASETINLKGRTFELGGIISLIFLYDILVREGFQKRNVHNWGVLESG